jgi:hypothetical protein
MRNIFFLIVGLFLSGCSFWHPFRSEKASALADPVAPALVAADVAILASDNAQAVALAKAKENEGKVLANVQAAKASNASQPPSHATTVVDGELGIAEQRLSGTQVDLAEKAAAAERAALVMSGKVEEARKAYETSKSEATESAKAVALAQADALQKKQESEAARQHEKDTILKFQAEILKDSQDTERKFNELKSAEAKAQALWLRILAGVCLIIFLAGTGFGQLAGAKIVWPFGVASLLLFGLAQIVTKTWFLWATGGVLAVLAGVMGWWIWQHYKQGDLLKATKEKEVKLREVASAVVPVLDKAYTTADASVKAWLDEHIFNTLNKNMDASAKATVHEIKAADELK